MAEWVTVEDVQTIARCEVSEASLVLAQEIVAMEAGVDSEIDLAQSDIISSRNVRFLQRAVAFQAIWLESHPDTLSAMDVTGVSQDGLSATYAAQNAHFLAPLAARFIRRLSWKLAPLHARQGRTQRTLAQWDLGNRDSAARDDQFVWAPLGRAGERLGEHGQVWT